MPNRAEPPSPYISFSIEEWSRLRDGERMTLDEKDLQRLRSLNDPISLTEAEETYLPLTRLLSYYVEAIQNLHQVSRKFLGTNGTKPPFIIGVAGSVAVGKSTTARILQALLQRWPSSPKTDLITTDGFLYPNSVLDARGLSDRKGFPESYDRARFIRFLSDVKSGVDKIEAPVYSHLVYDVLPNEKRVIEQPDILIVEGLNILQTGEPPANNSPVLFASDFIDFSIFIDAEEGFLRKWFVARFLSLRDTAFRDPQSFFHRFAKLSEPDAISMATDVWTSINLPNLVENILPTRTRADLILTKGSDHAIVAVDLRKL